MVLATEKKMPSPLMDPTTFQKICNLHDSAGIVYSGMGPDFRVLVKKGHKTAQQYFRQYQELMPLSQLARELATTMQEFTQQGYDPMHQQPTMPRLTSRCTQGCPTIRRITAGCRI